jgi:hypothetical protein
MAIFFAVRLRMDADEQTVWQVEFEKQSGLAAGAAMRRRRRVPPEEAEPRPPLRLKESRISEA